MSTLLDQFANWAWSSNPDPLISPTICTSTLSSPCITTLASKLLGLLIITGAFLNKAPLVKNILSISSVAGISPDAVYSETIMYANSASYSYLRQNPFTAWGENGVMTLQSLLVAVLVWKFKDDPVLTVTHRLLATLGFVIYLFGVFVLLQPENYYMLMAVNLPVLIYSRGSQIVTFWKCKHTGTMSLITTTMNLVGSCLRTLTTIQEVGWDWSLLMGYMTSVCLNLMLVMQFWVYRKGTEDYLAKLKEKKKAD